MLKCNSTNLSLSTLILTFSWCLKNADDEKRETIHYEFLSSSSSLPPLSSQQASTEAWRASSCLTASSNCYKQKWHPGKQLSMQHADYVAFNNVTQWAYHQAVKRGVLNRLLHSITPGAFWWSDQSHCKRHSHSLLIRHFNPCIQVYMEQISLFIKHGALIRSSWMALTKIWYNASFWQLLDPREAFLYLRKNLKHPL